METSVMGLVLTENRSSLLGETGTGIEDSMYTPAGFGTIYADVSVQYSN